jgi:AcrR family transcriptional regulator
MSPRIVDKEQRKKEIACVALDLFAENGFEATSISRVAQAAGIGKGTIYEYFRSKEELILQVIMVWAEGIEQQSFHLFHDTSDVSKRLKGFVHALMESFISDKRAVKFMVSMMQMFLMEPEVFQQYDLVRKTWGSMRRTLIDILLTGVSQGDFRPEIAKDAEKIVINLLAYLDGIALHYFMSRNYFELMEQVDFYLDHLLQNLQYPASKPHNV